MTESAEAIVVGGGPAGLTAAIALSHGGVDTVLVAPPPPEDSRTAALLASSVTALETLGVWERCRSGAAPLRRLRLVDDTGRLFRAPEVCFDAGEIGLDAFGFNIANRDLVAALEARASEIPALRRHSEAAADVAITDADVVVTLASGRRIAAQLAVGADGRHSLCRRAAGIATDSRGAGQTALALSFRHSRPHCGISTEFHTDSGPFTTVPLPGDRSSLVWVLGPGAARYVADWEDATLSAEIERRTHSILGKISVEPDRGIFPLAVESARQLAARRVVLIGEAAHVLPPIGAQGLNLGLRDAAQIAELAADARRVGEDTGSAALLARYTRLRQVDVASRMTAVDLLNRSILTDFLPVQALRGIGLYALDQVGPLRRMVMREGVAPTVAAPALMRGLPLRAD